MWNGISVGSGFGLLPTTIIQQTQLMHPSKDSSWVVGFEGGKGWSGSMVRGSWWGLLCTMLQRHAAVTRW